MQLSYYEVIVYRRMGVHYGLDLEKDYLEASPSILMIVCNGVGPAWFPDAVLEKVTHYYDYFLPSTNEHDFNYSFLDKTEEEFKRANIKLRRNMLRQIKKDFSDGVLKFWSLNKKTSLIRKILQANFLYEACVLYGRKAFFNE